MESVELQLLRYRGLGELAGHEHHILRVQYFLEVVGRARSPR